MKSRKYSLFVLLLCIILVLSMTGCWNQRELNTLAIVMGLSIDKTQVSNQLLVTAQVANPKELQSSPARSNAQAFWNIQNTGNTLFSILRDFTHISNRKLYFPHIQVLILGRDYAKEGIQEELDFFIRDHETRLNIWLVVSEGNARDVLDIEPVIDRIPAINISKLLDEQDPNSQTSTNQLNDFLTALIDRTTAPTAPLVEIVGKGDKKSLQVKGTAIFKDDKLVGELNKYETRGLLWVKDEVKSGIIDVECPEGDGKVSIELIDSKTKVSAEIRDNRVVMRVYIREKGALAAQYCAESFRTKEKVEALERNTAAAIQDEVLAAFRKAQELNADIFGFGEVVRKEHLKEWKDMKERWDEVFSEIIVEVTVDASIERSGRAHYPPVPDKE
ncbi:germination protein, Ger(X)C family [Desulfitobacterium dehalogenans ATCC 51507]|uniref:Germination protein, Ger(X)C family n=1 Tax=Desulfitobacterium dehalogenans (strain ATCC 51507 / DSM 9161 / JW/IU-DC1) TaxID=756499 RepID=I4A5C7_DESDJ|nr:Ger(x)C family spore germination protein [Desulfitobacterium dehalogenans]AFL99161.1 germination protein, Ger(X)C family [Desulfitobacterium dehalogenans ATCC 51507]